MRPPTAPDARPLAQGCPLGPRRGPSLLGRRRWAAPWLALRYLPSVTTFWSNPPGARKVRPRHPLTLQAHCAAAVEQAACRFLRPALAPARVRAGGSTQRRRRPQAPLRGGCRGHGSGAGAGGAPPPSRVIRPPQRQRAASCAPRPGGLTQERRVDTQTGQLAALPNCVTRPFRINTVPRCSAHLMVCAHPISTALIVTMIVGTGP